MNATVFHQAVAEGDATKVKFLINIGQQARVNQFNKHDYTALQQSCKDGRIEVVHVLLNHGANMNITGRKGRTALHLASAGGHARIVELLINSCADLNIKDKDGNLPVDVAKTEQIVKLLSSAEAEKKAKSAKAKKQCNSEDWSEKFNTLSAGSRNSMVSNSSSDSGVYTEDSSSSRNSDSKLSYLSSRNGLNRGFAGENRAMGVLNEWEEVRERTRFTAHTTLKPQPKLRRSYSERLPARRGRSLIRRRNISEELSALNLSCTNSRQGTDKYYYDCESELSDRDATDQGYTSIDSPSDDLDGTEVLGADTRRGSMREYPINEGKIEPRKHSNNTVVCYAGGDEGWEDDELVENSSDHRELSERPDVGSRVGWDEMDLYRRAQPGNLRGSTRRTVEIGELSHGKDQYLAGVNGYSQFSNNRQGTMSRTGRSHSTRENRRVANEFNVDQGARLSRKLSSCSDTEIGKYYQRRQDMDEFNELHCPSQYHLDYNEREKYCDWQNTYRDVCNNVPGYDEAMRHYSKERATRPASRQVSQV